jgi:hypothetical protein
VAFPTTSVLDDFNTGATQNLTARSGWAASPIWTGDTSWATDSTPTTATAPTTFSDNYYNTQATDSEVHVVITTAVSTTLRFWLRTAPGASPSGYTLQIDVANNWIFQKWVSGTPTTLGGTVVQAYGVGDAIGFEVISNALAAYYKASAGSWVQKLTTTDSTFTGAGYFGIEDDGGGTAIDSFSGGAVVVAGASVTQAGVNFSRRSGLVVA